jgi:hypothetical protein
MSTTNPMRENSELAKISWAPSEMPKRTTWGRKLIALGQRLSKLLRVRHLSKALEGDQEYHKYLGM